MGVGVVLVVVAAELSYDWYGPSRDIDVAMGSPRHQ